MYKIYKNLPKDTKVITCHYYRGPDRHRLGDPPHCETLSKCYFLKINNKS